MTDKEYIAAFHYDSDNKRCGGEPYEFREEIVRCKDCRFRKTETEDEGTSWYWCWKNDRSIDETDFCSWGERRE